MQKIIVALLSAAALVAPELARAQMPVPPASVAMQPLSSLVGTWQCNGRFPASGRTISSHVRIERDVNGSVLVKHHDDDAPGVYHAIEVWTFDSKAKHVVDTITDNFGGVRTYFSNGWTGEGVTFLNADGSDEFTYGRSPNGTLTIDYQRIKNGSSTLIDTLACSSSGVAQATASPMKCPAPTEEASATNAVSPQFTAAARAAHFPPTTALVEVTIGPNGKLLNATIYKSTGRMDLDMEAIRAARASQYAPKLVDCKPVIGDYLFRAEFNPDATPQPSPLRSP